MEYQEAIEVIKRNFSPSNRTMLCEALKLAIKILEEKIIIEKINTWSLDRE